MGKFKNMKFEVNSNLDEIVAELEKKGYTKYFWNDKIYTEFLITWEDGEYSNYSLNGEDSIYTLEHNYKLTTLAELKQMK